MAFRLLHSPQGDEIWVNTDHILFARAMKDRTLLVFGVSSGSAESDAKSAGPPVQIAVREKPPEIFTS